ncbi:FecR family protein [Ohtaekwangia kribbensis]|jgi:transmembrane sensor|uniref:FecR family protein n=1 Tax=Ohtaekwangia kribbensis TaxID=688913 RepID=A0ABW3K1B3_9BACT
MRYSNYSAEDLALDDSFRKWVLSPDDESTQFWNRWLESNPHREEDIHKAKQLVKLAGLRTDNEITTAFLDVWGKIKENAEQETQQQTQSTQNYRAWAAAIAAMMVLAAIYVLWPAQQADVTYRTAFGEIKEFILPDGSRVALNANSQLVYNTNWTGTKRKVFLTGEAFFDVVHTGDNKEFIVETFEDFSVQVLGTEFNVNTRKGNTAVYLQSGRIELQTAKENVILKPGDLAVIKDTNPVWFNRDAKAENTLAWKNNLFIYNDTPLSGIIQDIEDNFGVQVHVTESALMDKRVTAKISRKNVDVLLQVLGEILDVQIEQNKKQIVISPNHQD